jgi:DNA modification methylase
MMAATQHWQQGGFWDDEKLPEVRGKSAESLAYSRQNRLAILRHFHGELPMSIMAQRSVYGRARDDAAGSYSAVNYYAEHPDMADDPQTLQHAFGLSGQSVRRGALSQFPQNIGRAVLLLYSTPNDLVIDPFAGHNSRMELTITEGRRYDGYDISERFMDSNREALRALQRSIGDLPEVHLFEQDSRSLLHHADGVGDFTLTSPPYWNLEDYGDEPEQLGKTRSYENFLRDLEMVCRENFRVLRGGAFCVWFVNDFRKGGRFHPYHMDLTTLMTRAGFELFDTMIVDLGFPARAAFAMQLVESKILPKKHEYGMVFRKPEDGVHKKEPRR